MIDTDKYEGHTEGPWYLIGAHQIVYDKDNNPVAEVEYFAQEHRSYYNKALIADAPLILADYKRLRNRVKTEKNLKLWEKAEVKRLRDELDKQMEYIEWLEEFAPKAGEYNTSWDAYELAMGIHWTQMEEEE